jgi:hypothetical protein
MTTPVCAQPRMAAIEPTPQPFVIEENSTLLKVLSCIPILGAIVFKIQDYSMAQKVVRLGTDDRVRIIEFLKVSKTYQVTNIIRTVLTIALIVTGLALGVILKGLAIVSIAILVYRIVHCISNIKKHSETITELQTKG